MDHAVCLDRICQVLGLSPLESPDPVLEAVRWIVASSTEDGQVNLDFLSDQFAWFRDELVRAEASLMRVG